jgi:hypothetical protein
MSKLFSYGAFIIEWLILPYSNHLPLTAVDLNPVRDFRYSCKEAIQVKHRRLVVQLGYTSKCFTITMLYYMS